MCLVTLDGRYRRVNNAYAELVGRTPEELVGMSVESVVPPDDVGRVADMRAELIADPTLDARHMLRYVRPGGREVWGALNVSTVLGADGRPQYVFGQVVDRGDQRAARRPHALRQPSPGRDPRLLGLRARRRPVAGHRDRREPRRPDRRRQGGQVRERTGDGRAPAGARARPRPLGAHRHRLRGGRGRALLPGHDDRRHRRGRGARRARRPRGRVPAARPEHSGDVLSRHDTEGRYLYASPASERLYGLHPDELIGRSPCELGLLTPGEDRTIAVELADRYASGAGEAVTSEHEVTRPDGETRWVGTALRVVERQGARELVAVARDVTGRKAAEVERAYQAPHDSLTGLPNRVLFEDRLEQALRRARRHERGVALLFVDSDASSSSTTPSATRPATACCATSPRACAASCDPRTPSRASAATS